MGRTVNNMNLAQTAWSARVTARESRRQTALLRQMAAQSQPTAALAGWYPCVGDPVGSVRYWNGSQWTAGFKP